ncbi:hypothetical protein [Nostoc sp. DSM 114161]
MTKRKVSYRISCDRVAIRCVRERLALLYRIPTEKQASKSVSIHRRI